MSQRLAEASFFALGKDVSARRYGMTVVFLVQFLLAFISIMKQDRFAKLTAMYHRAHRE